MYKKFIILFLFAVLLVGFFIGPVSAVVFHQEWSSSDASHNEVTLDGNMVSYDSSWQPLEKVRFGGDLESWAGCNFIALMYKGSRVIEITGTQSQSYPFQITYNGKQYGSGYCKYVATYEESTLTEFYVGFWFSDFKADEMIADGLSSSTRFDISIDTLSFKFDGSTRTFYTSNEYGGPEVPYFIGSKSAEPYVGIRVGNITSVAGFERTWDASVYCDWFPGVQNDVDLYSNVYSRWNIWVENSSYTFTDLLQGSNTKWILGAPIHVSVIDPIYDYEHTYVIGEEVAGPDSFTLNLAVEDKATGSYLSGVSCIISDYNTSQIYFTDTLNGQKTYALNRTKTYVINVSALGYHYFDGNVSGEEYLQFYGQDPVDLTIGMYPDVSANTSSVIFSITEAPSQGGGIIDYASVFWDGSQTKYTNSNGRVTFSGVTYGTYNYRITKDDYTTVTGSITVNEPQEQVFVVLPRVVTPTPSVSPTPTINGTTIPGNYTEADPIEKAVIILEMLNFDEDTAKLVLGYFLVLMGLMFGGRVGGTLGSIIGVAIGMLAGLGLDLIPLAHVYVFMMIAAAIIAMKLR